LRVAFLFTSHMGRGEFFRLRRSAKWPPRFFLGQR